VQDSAHVLFVKALQHEAVPCENSGCPGPVDATDLSRLHDRVKTFQLRCERCGWQSRLSGREEMSPPWDDASLLMMADEHLMHAGGLHLTAQSSAAGPISALVLLLRPPGGDGLAACGIEAISQEMLRNWSES
jgi:hypothetical protein